MTNFLLDTGTSSRVIGSHRTTLRALRRSGATSLGISAVTRAELLYGAHMAPHLPNLMASVRTFLGRVDAFAWDDDAAEHHALLRASAARTGRSAGSFDMMIAAHALALGRTLVTGDRTLHALAIPGLAVVDWSI